MAFGVAVISAIIPGALWLWVFTHGRSYRGAPLKILMITFFLGVLSAIPALIAYYFIDRFVIEVDLTELATASIGSVAVVMFFVVGPVEETSKFLAVRLGVYRTYHLREPVDGLIYGAAASLGFATIENISYALSFGAEVMIVRGPVSTLGHVVFGSIWAASLNPQAPVTRRWLVGVAGLTGAALFHGLFNVLVFSTSGIWLPGILVGIGGYVVIRTFRRAKSRSTYHLRRNMPLRLCVNCSTPFRPSDNYCQTCGNWVKRTVSWRQQCANCHTESPAGVKYCSNCGDLFVYEDS